MLHTSTDLRGMNSKMLTEYNTCVYELKLTTENHQVSFFLSFSYNFLFVIKKLISIFLTLQSET